MTGAGTIVIAVLVVLNLATFAVFGWDKLCAKPDDAVCRSTHCSP